MAGTRQRTDVVKAKGRKHMTKAEEEQRRAQEINLPQPDELKAPDWLPKNRRSAYRALAKQLVAAKMGVAQLDADTVGRYIVAQSQYAAASEKVLELLDAGDQEGAADWSRLQEKYFAQARSCANDMGMTLTSRCKLVMPAGAKPEVEDNPFLQLIEGGRAANG